MVTAQRCPEAGSCQAAPRGGARHAAASGEERYQRPEEMFVAR